MLRRKALPRTANFHMMSRQDRALAQCGSSNETLCEVFPIDHFPLGYATLTSVAKCLLNFPDSINQAFELYVLQTGRVIGSFHRAVQGEMPLNHAGTQSNRTQRYGDATFVA